MAVRWLALLVLLVLAGAPTLGTGLAQTVPTTLAVAQGVVVVHADGQAETGQPGLAVGPGDRLETRRGGAATVRFPDGSGLELGAETTVDLQQIEVGADGSARVVASQSRGVSASRTAPGREASLHVGGGVAGGVAVLRQGGMVVRTDGDSGNLTLACESRGSQVFFPYEDRRVRCQDDVLEVFTASQEIVIGYLPPGVPAIVAVFDGDLVGRERGTVANREPEEKEAVAMAGDRGGFGVAPGLPGAPGDGTGGIGGSPTPTPTPLPPVSNDLFRNARSLAVPDADTADTRAATLEPDEPAPSCTLDTYARSVWYRVMPSTAGTLRISTAGSSYDTIVAVYSGPSLPFLSQRACNDNALGANRTSVVTLTVTAGETLYVQVTGAGGTSGTLQIEAAMQ